MAGYEYGVCYNTYNIFNIEPLGTGAVSGYGIYSGALPPGMSLSLTPFSPGPQYIQVIGACSFPGVYSFVIRYSQPPDVYFVSLQITVGNSAGLDTGAIPIIRYGETYYHVLNVLAENRNQADFTVAIDAGTLPSGIVFTPTIGSPTLSGETFEEGSFEVKFSITDNVNSCVSYQDYLFSVENIYLDVNLPCTKPGLPYKVTLAAGGGNYPYRYHLKTNYTLPNDLRLNTYSGVLEGSVYTEGIYVIGLRIFDARNNYIDKDLTLICSKECLPTTFDWLPSAQSPSVTVGEYYFQDNLKKFLPSIFEV